ncbi:stage II sporulation protein P [Parablautia muri]|uniref:Stage II sporulation protein P n=1 Tax=Parablautia muri TaxID=2320879 RepID=A0A9X5BD55_9FIRM|nr:stage II sporulation protein P [Parablautia muri]
MIRSNWRRIIKKWGIIGLVFACSICGFISFFRNKEEKSGGAAGIKETIAVFFNHQMEQSYFKLPLYLEESSRENSSLLKTEQLMARQFLLYSYLLYEGMPVKEQEDSLMAERISYQEGTDEDVKNIDEDNLDYGEDALHIENSMLEEMERENSIHQEEDTVQEPEPDTEDAPAQYDTVQGFEAAAYPAYTYDWSEKWDYESIVSNFYAMDNSTMLKEEYVDLNKLLYQDLSVNKESDGPQILIYHTHSREEFIDSIPGDSSTTIIGAGDKLAHLLEEKYGFKVLHHTEEYDSERDDAYNKSLPAITRILEENPTIEVVIDLHRDAVAGDRKLVMDLQGRPTARFMFFNGLSYGRKSGDITYLENPYIQDNLAFSFQAQVAANEYYPGIARKVYLKAYRFNMHLKPKCMLIELGAQNNTVEEIMNACDPLAHILSIVLNGGM